MSRIVKASHVIIDNENLINIEIMQPPDSSSTEEPNAPEADINDDNDNAELLIAQSHIIAEDIMKRARQDAQDIKDDVLQQAQVQAYEIRESSRLEGHKEGYSQGYAEAETIKEEARRIHEQALIQREEIINSIETDMITLIVSIIDKLLAAENHINPQVIRNLIKQGLSGATLTGDVRIRVSQMDYEFVSSHKDEILTISDSSDKWEIVTDMSLNQFDCVIETPFGNIDCSLTRQAEELKKDLYYILENR